MFSRKFMEYYVGFLAMMMTLLIIGPIYYFGTKYMASFVGENYQQAMAIILGIFSLAAGYKMMAVIEQNKKAIIAKIEESVNTRFF
jgi:general stress protein CsbA